MMRVACVALVAHGRIGDPRRMQLADVVVDRAVKLAMADTAVWHREALGAEVVFATLERTFDARAACRACH